jgi:RimJ/RimL family protein N-acetyltransferase
LQLREWRLDDADAALQIYGDPEVVQFLGDGKPVPDLATQRHWLTERIERYRTSALAGFGAWAMVERDTEQVVGTMLLKPLPPTTDEIEIGWHLARRAWGRGYATEAGRAVLRYGFVDLRLDRIVAVIRPANARSAAVALRIGMGWLERVNRYYGGEALDLYAIERESAGYQ